MVVASVAHCAWMEFARTRPKPTAIDIGEWDSHGAGDARDYACQWLLWACKAEWVGARSVDHETLSGEQA